MEKFSWHRGETRWLDVMPEEAGGASIAALYPRAQMRISMPGSCVIIEGMAANFDNGTVQGEGFRFELNDAVLDTIPRGVYDFAIWMQSNVGWECVSDDFKIMISRAC